MGIHRQIEAYHRNMQILTHGTKASVHAVVLSSKHEMDVVFILFGWQRGYMWFSTDLTPSLSSDQTFFIKSEIASINAPENICHTYSFS